MNFELWFWVALGVITVASLLWGYLILHDVNHEIKSQLWVVGEEHIDLVFTTKLKWIKRCYVLGLILLSILTFSFILFS